MSARRFASPILLLVAASCRLPPREAGPHAIRVVHDVAYTEAPIDPRDQRLDLYLPEGPGPFPVLVWVHGGAWRWGDKHGPLGLFAHIGETFASHGIATAMIDYRLALRHKHPAQIEDVARAFAWVREHVADFGGDPERIVVGGHSAGAHLAALLALDEGYLAAEGGSPAAIRGVVGVSGPYDLAREGVDEMLAAWLLYDPAFGSREAREAASPARHVRADAPPFLVVWGTRDPAALRESGRELAAALRHVGAAVEEIEVPGRGHFTIASRIGRRGDPATSAILAFLRRLIP